MATVSRVALLAGLAAGGLAGTGAAANAVAVQPPRLVTVYQPGETIAAGTPRAVVGLSTAASGGGWGTAIEVPGTASLNVGGAARVQAVSCTARGYCAAGGAYGTGVSTSNANFTQAFVVSRQHGRWGRAIEVPGLAGLEAPCPCSGISQINSMSCASPGNCAAGGYFIDGRGSLGAFVVSEVGGKWHRAVQVARALNVAGFAQVYSVSCPSAGNCDAAGSYATGPGPFYYQPFLVRERNTRWGTAFEVPRTAALNASKIARAASISCPSAGNCAVGGYYSGAGDSWQAFVASQRNGLWSPAIEVPGTAAVNIGGNATIESVSCPSPGNCAASGYYKASAYDGSTAKWQAFVVSQRDGKWGNATAVLRTPAVGDNTPGAAAESVSCPSGGNCVAGGTYLDGSSRMQAFVVSQRDSNWGKAIEVPGTDALNRGGAAEVLSVSCASAGYCSAAGYYTDDRGSEQAFIASERNGQWGKAITVPGTLTLNKGGSAALTSVSCPPGGLCGAGGTYLDHSGSFQAFVVSQTHR